jgi:NADH-quinone oxidoreductase subunit F
VAERLGLGPAEAYGVATFYDLISTEPMPPRVAHVCDDIACRASGVESALAKLGADLGPADTDCGGVMWKRSPCLGQCEKGSAAFIQVAGGDHVSVAPVTPEQLIEILGAAHPAHRVAPDEVNQLTSERAVLAGVGEDASLSGYQSRDGYVALRRALAIGASPVVDEVVASGILGRGGAAFPAGIKWRAVAANDGPKYVICNADESEPGTFKDRVILERDPFAIVEAMTIAGFAVDAETGYLYLRGEYPIALTQLTEALDAARSGGLLGHNILGSGYDFDIEIRRGAGAYICGEETALFNSIEGYRGEPRQKPPFPTDAGLFGRPTLVNNVETLANIPRIVRDGGAAFAAEGTEGSTGTKIFCLSGDVATPGVYEVPFGATVADIIDLGGGLPSDAIAVLVGGAAGSFLSPDDLDIPLTFEATRERGISLGSGVIMVFDSHNDMGSIVGRITEFFAHESCGLCIPCRAGTVRQNESVVRLRLPSADRAHEFGILDQLDQALRDGSVCGLGQAASVAVQSAVSLGLIGSAS